MATFVNETKNVASFSNQSKNTTVFTNEANSNIANLWASSVDPWLLDLPWQYDTDVIDLVFTLQNKN